MDGRIMAAIKLGKPLILLMQKEEPSIQIAEQFLTEGLKAQLMSLQKIAYEAYGKSL
jgi:hypothetical protein